MAVSGTRLAKLCCIAAAHLWTLLSLQGRLAEQICQLEQLLHCSAIRCVKSFDVQLDASFDEQRLGAILQKLDAFLGRADVIKNARIRIIPAYKGCRNGAMLV